ncbi:MAG: hypothetical protein ACOYBR_09645 [Fluviibacter sp.]
MRKHWPMTAASMTCGAMIGHLIAVERLSDAGVIVCTGVAAYLGAKLGADAVIESVINTSPPPGREWFDGLLLWMRGFRTSMQSLLMDVKGLHQHTDATIAELRARIEALESAARAEKTRGAH